MNLQKKKIKLYFHTWFLLVTQGIKTSSILNNMFVNKRNEPY